MVVFILKFLAIYFYVENGRSLLILSVYVKDLCDFEIASGGLHFFLKLNNGLAQLYPLKKSQFPLN